MNESRRTYLLPLFLLAASCVLVQPMALTSAESESESGQGQITSVPLNSSEGQDSQQFVALSADQTGIDFEHKWAPPEHDYDFRTLLNGGAVCLGDFDGDGLADVYLTRQDDSNRLYQNLGDFKFRDVTAAAGLLDEFWGMGATFVDIDNDGDLDLYACAFQSPNRLYINQGDGTFADQAKAFGLDYNGASIMLAVADYDNDGNLDAYLLTNRRQPKNHAEFEKRALEGFHASKAGAYFEKDLWEFMTVVEVGKGKVLPTMAGQKDKLFRNTGKGTFEDVSTQSGIQGYDLGLAATWWDYNDDGLPDLYVSNDYLGPDRLYRNDGAGKFTDVALEAFPHTPWSSMGADLADLNNDGLMDFMGADMSSTSHYRSKVTMGDMSSMGWFLESAEPRQYMRNAIYINSGTNRFMEVAKLAGMASTDWTWAVKLADLDDDGRVDAFFTNGMTRDWENADLEAEVERLGGYHSPAGKQFWIDQPSNPEPNHAYRNLGDLRFESKGADWGLDHKGVSFGAALGDLDGDGDLDLVVNNHEAPVSVYRNEASTGNRIKIRLVGTASNRWGIGATVRLNCVSEKGAAEKQIRYLTLARGIMSSDEPLVHFGLGKNETIDQLSIHWPSGHVQKFSGLAVNRFYTITEPTGKPKQRESVPSKPTMFTRVTGLEDVKHQEEPYDDYLRQPLLPNKLSQMGPGMAWGDLDGDGLEDLYLGGGAGHSGGAYRNTGDGSFEELREFLVKTAADADSDSEDMGVLMFDVEGDGDLDVYVVSGGAECDVDDASLRDRIYLNDGQGNLTKAPDDTLPDFRDSGSVVAAADFDRDGDLDLFVGGRVVPGQYPVTPRSRLLRNDQGKFTDVTESMAPGLAETGLVTSAIWSDADRDGWLDLLVTHDWGPVQLLLNQQGQLVDRTAEAGLAERLGWYKGIAAGDLDHDGDIDYVVTNVGLNTKYRATPKKPARIYYGDFEGTGSMHIVEAKMKGDIFLPVRGKSCSQNAMPFVSKKFPKYHDFAISTLADIYTPTCLADAITVEANSLESGVLINDGEAHFTFHALPRTAQIAPGFGVVLTEINGDGNPDLIIAQNSYSPQRETGRMAGGMSLLLLGNGDGTFEPIWPNESGIVIPHDAKSLTLTDLNRDGWPDFVVGVNDRPVEAFLNNGSAGRRVITVKLKGTVGNLSAVGALVTVEMASGSQQTAEISAGGGYLSQSSSTLTFGLPSDEEFRAVHVRWPDGSETSHSEGDSRVEVNILDSPGT